MFRQMRGFGRNPDVVVRGKTTYTVPLTWKEPKRIFTCSWSDFFVEEGDQWRAGAWLTIEACKQHVFQILTKRPERIKDHLPYDWGEGYPNVWLGVSVELQQYTARMDVLRKIPAAVRFVSAEPLLGPLELDLRGFGWVITGGESDYVNPRLAEANWFCSIRDQCQKAGVAYFHKQNGGKRKCACHRAWGCRLLDGRTWDEYPG
jgi:protein gp37